VHRSVVAGQAIDKVCQLDDASLDAGSKIVDLTRHAAQRSKTKPLDQILDEDEVPACNASVVQRQCALVERHPDECRDNIAPHRVGRAAPAAGAKNLARPIDVLKARLYERKAIAHEEVITLKLTDQLRNRIWAVVVERDRRILRRGLGAVERLFGNSAAGRGIDHFLQGMDILKPAEQLQAGDGVVVVISNRVGDRRLISVIASQMKRKVYV